LTISCSSGSIKPVHEGWQASGTTLSTLRFVTHALRGWPTPLGVTINSATAVFDQNGSMIDQAAVCQLQTMVGQLLDFAANFRSPSQDAFRQSLPPSRRPP
jgi:FMN reductase